MKKIYRNIYKDKSKNDEFFTEFLANTNNFFDIFEKLGISNIMR